MAFDAFISFKNTAPGGGHTVDYEIAKKLHRMLLDEGMNVFFSEKDLSTAEFAREIYGALDEARLLILIGSSVEYINSTWVESEWQNFLGAIYSGKKPGGQVITVLSGISARELPIQLSNLQSFSAGDLDSAVSFAFKALGMVRNSEVRERLAAEAARKEREAEEARLAVMRRQMEAELQAEREQKAAERRRERERKAAEAARKLAERRHKRELEVAEKASKLAERRQERELKAAEEASKRREKAASAAPASGKRGAKVAAVMVCLLVVLGVVGYLWQMDVWQVQEEDLSSYFSFEEVDGGYKISSYLGGLGDDVVLPSTYRDMPVISIGEYTFKGCDNLTSITIPSSVTSIRNSAFCDCTSLTSITIPDSVTSIGRFAFSDCSNLTSITIPNSVTSIGDSAFYRCTSLPSITIPDNINIIGDKALYGCTNLTSINIPDSVTIIGDSAFKGCTSLTTITIPDRVVSIGISAFYDCANLTSITIPDSMIKIGNGAFYGCNISVTAPHVPSYYGYHPAKSETWKIKE